MKTGLQIVSRTARVSNSEGGIISRGLTSCAGMTAGHVLLAQARVGFLGKAAATDSWDLQRLWIFSALKRCFSSIRNFFSIQMVLFQHPRFSQHPRCFISTCGVFPTPEKECFCSISKVFFDDQVFSPHPEVFFQHQLMSVFSAPSGYFLSRDNVNSTCN